MSNISFTCPHCSFSKQLPASAEGMQGNCPSCKAVVTISADASANPAISPQQSPSAPEKQTHQTQTTTKPPSNKKPFWLSRGLLASISIVIFSTVTFFMLSTDAMNDLKAQTEQSQYDAEWVRVGHVIEGFDEGIVSAGVTAMTINEFLDTLSTRSQQISYDKTTGNLGIGLQHIGLEGFWGTDNGIIAKADASWETANSKINRLIPRVLSAASSEVIGAMEFKTTGNVAADKETARKALIKKLGGEEAAKELALRAGTVL